MTRRGARDHRHRLPARARSTTPALAAVAACLWLFACDNRVVSLGKDPLLDTGSPSDEGDADVAADAGGDAGDDAGVRACGSRGLPPCESGEFCRYPLEASCGKGDAPGVCTKVPVDCPFERDSVCGCDGQTYPNECEAQERRVSVASLGPCPDQPGEPCGPRNGFACPPGKFCDPSSSDCFSSGECRALPTMCVREIRPVCGCDGWTYPNPCLAHANATGVRNEGPCPNGSGSSGGNTGGDPSSYLPCGGSANMPCPSDEFCDYALGDGCDVPDAVGRCRERVPEGSCPQFHMPVCGCDGTTYDNLCLAYAAEMTVDFAGECP